MADSAESDVDASGASNTYKGDGDSDEALCRGGGRKAITVICCGCGCGGAVKGDLRRVRAREGGGEVEERGGAGDENNAKEGDHASNLLDAGKELAE